MPQSAAQTALFVDDLLCRPELASLAEQLRARNPQWFKDQYAAATAVNNRVMEHYARDIGATPGLATPAQFPDWLRLGLLLTMAQWGDGTGSTCPHRPDLWHPSPVVAAAWAPGTVVCPRCIPLITLAPGSVKDRTCGGCGHVCSGPDSGDPIYPSSVTYGPLTYLVGTCTGCRLTLPSGAESA